MGSIGNLRIGVERCRKLILLSISRNFGKKLRYYQQQLLQFQQPKIELQSCTLSFLQSCFCSFCRYNFGNFFLMLKVLIYLHWMLMTLLMSLLRR